MRLGGALLAVTIAACASRPPIQTITERNAAYNTDFNTVWQATTSELNEAFKWGLEVADASTGRIETSWKRVENARDIMTRDGETAQYVFRVRVQLVPEGSGWRIELDGEAALYRPDMSMLTPFKHGDVDEPQWVQGRIDAVRSALHRRLVDYATLSRPTIIL